MTILRSHSILSAHMDNIEDVDMNDIIVGKTAKANEPQSIVRKTKEKRLHDEQTEEEGCRKILEALTPEEIEDMSDENLLIRHYRADKGNIPKAIKRIKYAIKWRKDMKVKEMLKAAHNPETEEEHKIRNILMHEAETGKMFVRGYDKEERAILWIYQKRENSNNPEHNIMHLVYQIERLLSCTEKMGYEKAVIVLDFDGWKMKHASSLDITKKTIHILQDCYVERLARVYFSNAPGIFRTFYSMVKGFIDPNTRNKIKFLTDEVEKAKYFDPETAESCIFGQSNLREYNVEDYFSVPLNVSFDENAANL